jgi:ABC-type transport system involved in multi-copper enzyme maturation permease subunit
VLLRHPSALYLLSSLLMALLAIHYGGRRLATEAEPRRGILAGVIDRKRSQRAPPDHGNPVAWKEQRLLNTAASRPLYYTVIALLTGGELFFLFSCGGWLAHEQEMMEFGLAFATVHPSLIGLVAVVAGAAAMAHERTVGTLDLLRASPLTPREILRGKLGGLLRGLGLLFLIPLAHLGILVASGFMDPLTAVGTVLIDGTFLLFFSMLGILAGLSADRMGAAVTRGALLFGVFLVAIPAVATVIALGFNNEDDATRLITGWPPVTCWLVMEGGLRLLHPPWNAYYGQSSLPLESDHEAAFAWAAAYGIAAVLAWRFAPWLLARRFEREREGG